MYYKLQTESKKNTAQEAIFFLSMNSDLYGIINSCGCSQNSDEITGNRCV